MSGAGTLVVEHIFRCHIDTLFCSETHHTVEVCTDVCSQCGALCVHVSRWQCATLATLCDICLCVGKQVCLVKIMHFFGTVCACNPNVKTLFTVCDIVEWIIQIYTCEWLNRFHGWKAEEMNEGMKKEFEGEREEGRCVKVCVCNEAWLG